MKKIEVMDSELVLLRTEIMESLKYNRVKRNDSIRRILSNIKKRYPKLLDDLESKSHRFLDQRYGLSRLMVNYLAHNCLVYREKFESNKKLLREATIPSNANLWYAQKT